MSEQSEMNPVELATELTIAWLGNQNNRIQADEVPEFLKTMHATITSLANGESGSAGRQDDAETEEQHAPAVSVRKSLASPDHILSMIDGKPYKTLRRHLSSHGMTPEQYRERYNLKPDYPMVARTYSEARRAMAQKIGLGRKRRNAPAAEPAAKTPARRGRKPAGK